MATITTRSGKGSPLTNTEVDNNFTNLNTAKYESGDDISVGSINASGNMTFNASAARSEQYLQIGTGMESGYAYIDLVGDDTYTDYGLRIIRGNSGADTTSSLQHRGEGNFYFNASDGDNSFVFNEVGVDTDFRVESNDKTHMLFIDAFDNTVGIGESNPLTALHVSTSAQSVLQIESAGSSGAYIRLRDADTTATQYGWVGQDANTLKFFANNNIPLLGLNTTAAVFNENGNNVDFRVESDSNANMLFVDAGNDYVSMGTSDQLAGGLGVETPTSAYSAGNSFNKADVSTLTLYNSGAAGIGQGPFLAFQSHYSGDGGSTWTGKAIFGAIAATPVTTSNTGSGKMRFFVANEGVASYLRENATFYYNSNVFNEDSNNVDFRVESDGQAYMLFVDGGEDKVGVRTANPAAQLDVNGRIAARTGDYGTYNTGILEITSGESNPQVKITTNIKYSGSGASTHAHTVKISGFNYGTTETCNIQVCWHVYQNQFWARCASSSGGFAPEVTLAVENNFVVIHLGNVGYWPKLYVESMYNAYGGPGHAQDWTWSDAAISADANTPNQTVAYRTDLGGRNEIGSAGAIFNDGSSSSQDFRVESDAHSHMMFLDSDANTVLFGRDTHSWTNNCVLVGNPTSGGMGITANGDWGLQMAGSRAERIRFFSSAGGSVTVGSIQVTTSGTKYNTTSDRRLKDNIEAITDGTETLMAMKPVTHTWKADPEADAVHGFIAQEMMDVLPEAVSGDPDGEEMMSMDYGRITPVLVAALQDAHKKIAELETRLNELEGKE